MKIFPRKADNRKKYTDVFCGFHLSKELEQMLRMLSLTGGESISTLIRKSIINYIQQSKYKTEGEFIQALVQMGQASWELYSIKHGTTKKNFLEFCGVFKEQLRRRKIENQNISTIVKQLKYKTNGTDNKTQK